MEFMELCGGIDDMAMFFYMIPNKLIASKFLLLSSFKPWVYGK